MKKIKKSNDVFGQAMKSFRKESVLIFCKKLMESGVLSTFKFFLITPENGRRFVWKWVKLTIFFWLVQLCTYPVPPSLHLHITNF